MKSILIVKEVPSTDTAYVIDHLASMWESGGHKVITVRGVDALPPADVVVLHVDATRVPAEYREALNAYPVVLNRNVLDISKRKFSMHIVDQHDDYRGPVIVKTNANFGGRSGLDRLRPAMPTTRKFDPPTIGNAIQTRLLGPAWRDVVALDPRHYPIFPSPERVPKGVWENDALVVEKFLPEKQDGLYFLRYWMFLGNRGHCARFGSRKPCVKFSTAVTEHETVPVPAELEALRARLGFDYGRFDFVEHDGRVIVFDINKTVGVGRSSGKRNTPLIQYYKSILEDMAVGIEQYLG